MKTVDKQNELRKISGEEVEKMLNNGADVMAYGCGCGCGTGSGDDRDFDWRIVGCGNGKSIDMGSGSGMEGVDRKNHKPYNITLEKGVTDNALLTAQINELLACSKDLRDILSPYINGQGSLSIDAGQMSENPRAVMEADVQNNGIAKIMINSSCITENGFDAYTYGTDSSGYQNDGTAACMFSTALTHEALHAKHFYWYYESRRYGGQNDDAGVAFLKEHNFSDDYINIFYDKDGDNWKSVLNDTTLGRGEVEKREHIYFKNHDIGILDLVKNDFNNRYGTD